MVGSRPVMGSMACFGGDGRFVLGDEVGVGGRFAEPLERVPEPHQRLYNLTSHRFRLYNRQLTLSNIADNMSIR